jgi:hypothetical protein
MYIGVQATEMWHQGLTNIRTQWESQRCWLQNCVSDGKRWRRRFQTAHVYECGAHTKSMLGTSHMSADAWNSWTDFKNIWRVTLYQNLCANSISGLHNEILLWSREENRWVTGCTSLALRMWSRARWLSVRPISVSWVRNLTRELFTFRAPAFVSAFGTNTCKVATSVVVLLFYCSFSSTKR